ncbi:hypothetical protein BJV74DRAFT_794890 [Russula compacta]|nr:hypothetical protein BJV74DRAFT_794890 [Russula compacta]
MPHVFRWARIYLRLGWLGGMAWRGGCSAFFLVDAPEIVGAEVSKTRCAGQFPSAPDRARFNTKYKKTLDGALKPVKRSARTLVAEALPSAAAPIILSKDCFKEGAVKRGFKPLGFQTPHVLTGKAFDERRRGRMKMGNRYGYGRNVDAATTEGGACDGAPDQQQYEVDGAQSWQNPLGECLWSTR